jgi:hypothetical protein
LTPAERSVIERLLSADFRDVQFFRRQVEAITVTSVCPCGCGTLSFAVDPETADAAPSAAWRNGPDILVEGDSESWLMLFQEDGWLTELEHVAGYGPNPEDLDASTITPDVQVEEDWFR